MNFGSDETGHALTPAPFKHRWINLVIFSPCFFILASTSCWLHLSASQHAQQRELFSSSLQRSWGRLRFPYQTNHLRSNLWPDRDNFLSVSGLREYFDNLHPFLLCSDLHYSLPVPRMPYDCILYCTVEYVLSNKYVAYLYVLSTSMFTPGIREKQQFNPVYVLYNQVDLDTNKDSDRYTENSLCHRPDTRKCTDIWRGCNWVGGWKVGMI